MRLAEGEHWDGNAKESKECEKWEERKITHVDYHKLHSLASIRRPMMQFDSSQLRALFIPFAVDRDG